MTPLIPELAERSQQPQSELAKVHSAAGKEITTIQSTGKWQAGLLTRQLTSYLGCQSLSSMVRILVCFVY